VFLVFAEHHRWTLSLAPFIFFATQTETNKRKQTKKKKKKTKGGRGRGTIIGRREKNENAFTLTNRSSSSTKVNA
jgi:hypothetical protein